MKRTAKLALFAVLCFALYPVAELLFPPATLGFWRLALTRRFELVGSPNAATVEFYRIADSVAPGLYYRVLFAVGSKPAKAYALMGIQAFAFEDFESYCSRFEAVGGDLPFYRTFLTTDVPVAAFIDDLRDGPSPFFVAGQNTPEANQSVETTP